MPKSEQRMELIGSTILEQARQESESIREAADAEHAKAIQHYRDNVIDEMYAKIQDEIAAIKEEGSRTRAKAQKDVHRALLGRRMELEAHVFANVRMRLMEYAKTPQYRQKLLDEIRALKDRYDHTASTVYLRAEDEALSVEVEKMLPGCKVIPGNQVKIGGFKLENTAAGILADATLEERLRLQRPWFLTACGMKVVAD